MYITGREPQQYYYLFEYFSCTTGCIQHTACSNTYLWKPYYRRARRISFVCVSAPFNRPATRQPVRGWTAFCLRRDFNAISTAVRVAFPKRPGRAFTDAAAPSKWPDDGRSFSRYGVVLLLLLLFWTQNVFQYLFERFSCKYCWLLVHYLLK